VDSSEVPGDAGAGLRRRLARRKLGPVPVAFPEGFGWPGRFLVLGRGVATWAVSFGVSPGVVFDPAAETDGTRRPSLRPRSCWRSTIRRARPDGPGVVELIALAAEAEGPMTVASSAEVVAGCEASATGARSGPSLAPRGADTTSFWWRRRLWRNWPRAASGSRRPRRNLVVRGIALDGLVGKRFRVGGRVLRPAALRAVRAPRTAHAARAAARPGATGRAARRRVLRRGDTGRGRIEAPDPWTSHGLGVALGHHPQG
jgi:hypothetical protein